MSSRRTLRFEETEEGCFVPVSHKLNQDGYFRKRWRCEGGSDVGEMFHRFIYRAHHGEIPEGHEVDHMCRNRACCNPEHLQALSRRDHLVKTNKERYASRKTQAKKLWLETKCTGTRLSELFDVSFSSGCRWIREWESLAAI